MGILYYAENPRNNYVRIVYKVYTKSIIKHTKQR